MAHLLHGVEEVGERDRGPQRRPRDQRSDRDAFRLDRDRAEQRERFDRGAPSTGTGAEQMVEHEHGVEP